MNPRSIAVVGCIFIAASALAQTPPTKPAPPTAPTAPRAQPGPPAAQLAQRLMQGDKNGDGKLSAEELPPQFRDQVAVLDTNKDGFLEVAELSMIARGQADARSPQGGRGGAPQSFDGAMKRTNRAFEGLEESAFDAASKAQDLEQVQGVQAGLIAAKGMISSVRMAPQAKAKYGEDVAKYHADMRAGLINAIVASLALEQAIIAGDQAAAKAALKRLDAIEHTSHDSFKEPEEEEGKDAPKGPPSTGAAKP